MLKYSVLSVIVIAIISQQCVLVDAQCTTTTCLNGGTCGAIDTTLTYCNCTASYTGEFCQTAVSACASTPCLNGGTCGSIDVGIYYCNCTTGYSGQNCQTAINACISKPCKNGAACTPTGSTYQCTCRNGCYGSDCSYCITTTTVSTTTLASACLSSPCKNGGICTPVGSSFYCTCPSNCQGYNCAYCIGTTKATCADYNSNVCKAYAAIGYCSSNAYINGSLFKVSCPVSCNNCASLTTKSPSTCVDQQANCAYWANYCYLINSPNPCPKTCKLC